MGRFWFDLDLIHEFVLCVHTLRLDAAGKPYVAEGRPRHLYGNMHQYLKSRRNVQVNWTAHDNSPGRNTNGLAYVLDSFIPDMEMKKESSFSQLAGRHKLLFSLRGIGHSIFHRRHGVVVAPGQVPDWRGNS